jgi:hypothetical protein
MGGDLELGDESCCCCSPCRDNNNDDDDDDDDDDATTATTTTIITTNQQTNQSTNHNEAAIIESKTPTPNSKGGDSLASIIHQSCDAALGRADAADIVAHALLAAAAAVAVQVLVPVAALTIQTTTVLSIPQGCQVLRRSVPVRACVRVCVCVRVRVRACVRVLEGEGEGADILSTARTHRCGASDQPHGHTEE